MFARLSIWGLYNFRPDIFDNLTLPDGVDKDRVIETITTELSDLSVIYSNPDMLKKYIGVWSSIHVITWRKLHDTTQFDYDPISNYDRHEEWTDNASSTGTGVERVAGFNAVELVDRSSSEAGGESEGSHSGHIYGNIGVTTTQHMISEEREVVKFNIYDHICEDFKNRFCVMVY